VSEVATGPLISGRENDLGVKSVKGPDRLAKQKPGAIRFASAAGIGSSLGVSTASCRRLPASASHGAVPRRGSGAHDLLGAIDAMIDAMPVMSVQAKEGRSRRLRSPAPSARRCCPTCRPCRRPASELCRDRWYGIVAPARTPPSIAQKLRDEASKAIGPAMSSRRSPRRHGAARHTARRICKYLARSSHSIPRSSRREHQAPAVAGLSRPCTSV